MALLHLWIRALPAMAKGELKSNVGEVDQLAKSREEMDVSMPHAHYQACLLDRHTLNWTGHCGSGRNWLPRRMRRLARSGVTSTACSEATPTCNSSWTRCIQTGGTRTPRIPMKPTSYAARSR